MSSRLSNILALTFLLKSIIVGAIAPPVKYWILLKNKNGINYSLNNPSQFLTQKSIDRRAKYSIPYHVTDLPVNLSYVSLIDTVKGVKVLYVSKWLNGVVISIDSASVAQSALNAISSFSFVGNNTKVKKYKFDLPLPVDPLLSTLEKTNNRNSTTASCGYNYGGSNGQIKQLNLDCLHESGYQGQGMTIAVMDVGFTGVDSSPVFDSLRMNSRIIGTRDFIDGGSNAYTGGSHGFNVLSCLAAFKSKVAIGTAPKASYWLFRTEDGLSETLSEEYNWIRAAEFADSVGVDIITTSLGYTEFDSPSQNHTYATLNGRTAPMSIAANLAARKGIFVLNAAGNEGANSWRYISVPADADSICSVGAVDTLGNYAFFSSVGPTPDGRIKPDLAACGSAAWICDAFGNCFPGNGTSFATPVLAGAVACYWQAHRSDNNIKVLNDLKQSGSNSSSPNNQKGWGVPKIPCTRPLCNNLISAFTYTLGNDGLIKLTSTSTGTNSNTELLWSFGDGTSLAGSSSIKHIFGSSGTYSVSLLAEHCFSNTQCRDLSDVQTVVINLDFDFTSYIEPNTSIIKLNLTKITYDFLIVEIYDMLGHLLFSSTLQNTENTLDFNAQAISGGTYIVKVKTSKGTKIKKFIKF